MKVIGDFSLNTPFPKFVFRNSLWSTLILLCAYIDNKFFYIASVFFNTIKKFNLQLQKR